MIHMNTDTIQTATWAFISVSNVRGTAYIVGERRGERKGRGGGKGNVGESCKSESK